MHSVVPASKYDIFISYRQKDNKGERWVTDFVHPLKTELDRGTTCTLVEIKSPCEMIATKSHTHCLAALAAHIQSQSKSVLSVV